MGELQQSLTNTIGGFFASGVVQLGLKLVLGYVVVVWLATAYWAFRDMRSRTESLILPYVAGGLIVLFSPLFFWLGLFVYRIVRPSEHLGERRERELAEAVLLNEVGEIEQCAGCRRIVQPDWVVCPSCRTELRERCRSCDRLVEFDWLTCAWCGTDLGRQPARREIEREKRPAARQPVPVMDPASSRVPVMDPGARVPEWPTAPQVALSTRSNEQRAAQPE